MLTIGQLAAAAGVTVRTVRHYHQVGLLPEPGRDGSGYRRYPAHRVVDLIRIRTLADAGVPLSRVEDLLQAPAKEFATALSQLDEELQRRIGELGEYRRRIAALRSGEALHLPPEVIANLDRLRALGVGEHALQIERDAWILMCSLEPETLPQRLREKNASFSDPATMSLYLAIAEAIDWAADDPRIDGLIDQMEAWEIAFERGGGRTSQNAVLSARIADASPVMRRILDELAHRADKRHPVESSRDRRAKRQ